MDSATESSLIEALEKSIYEGIHERFRDFLQPFSDLVNLKPSKSQKNKKKKAAEEDRTVIRSLAKKFLPFLNRALSILPKRICESPKPGGGEGNWVQELFDAYKLCLDCLSCLSSQLSCKPYSVHLQAVRMVHCYESCGRYGEAEKEGLRILESLRGINFGGSVCKTSKGKNNGGSLLPNLTKENSDPELGILQLEVVVTIIKCAFMSQNKEGEEYRRILALVDQVKPWLRVIDANEFEKFHKVFVTCLNKCMLFMMEEFTCFDGDLVRLFCLTALSECVNSSVKDQYPKFVRRICSSLFLRRNCKPQFVVDMLKCVLDSFICDYKVDEVSIDEFIDLVCYFSHKCRTASMIISKAIAGHLIGIASNFLQVLVPTDLVVRLYATVLYITGGEFLSKGGESSISENLVDDSAVAFFHDNEEYLQQLPSLLDSLGTYFRIDRKENKISSSHTDSKAWKHRHGKASMLSYLNALEFLCQALADLVCTMRKRILGENEGVLFSAKLHFVQDAFQQYGDLFLISFSCTFEIERDGFKEKWKTLLNVAVAALTVSFGRKMNMEGSVDLIDRIVSTEWIQPHELKFLFTSLYNTGIVLYRTKKTKEASKALNLCCRMSWNCISLLCQKFVDKPEGIRYDLSEDVILGFVTEACERSAFLLDILHRLGNHDVKKFIVDTLLNWSIAGNLFESLNGPMPLVKQWVKIVCKDFNNDDMEKKAPTLYSLLSKSPVLLSKKIISMILEQELVAYEGINAQYPVLSQIMQLQIINTLLLDIYVTKDCRLQRAKIFIRKGRALRAREIDDLNECVQCLSEAISILNDLSLEPSISDTAICQNLALVYCLRALCTQEAESKSEVIFNDICHALRLWEGANKQGYWSTDGHSEMMIETTIKILFHIADLLSLKGQMHFHDEIYKLIFILMKRKNIPLENCLCMLWASGRLTHALCASPVDEVFISIFSEHFGTNSNSFGFWKSCMKDSQPLLAGFQQKFSFYFPNMLSLGSNLPESHFLSYVSVDWVKKAASDILSSVPVSSHSSFLVGYLYHDLCERLISTGHLLEALSYAKEALRLRSKLLREKFVYFTDQQNENVKESAEKNPQMKYACANIHLYRSVAIEVWPSESHSLDLESCILSPWNVLQCYLESVLQVGFIHEAIGNGAEAEAVLLWGKNISYTLGLPLCQVAFASLLGKLYRKKQLWEFAEIELNSAKQILADASSIISCKRCKLTFEVTIDQQIGDLNRSQFDVSEGISLVKSSYFALGLYRSALEKLNHFEWEDSLSISEGENAGSNMLRKTLFKEAEQDDSNTSAYYGTNHSNTFYLKMEADMAMGSLKDFIRMKWEFHRRRLSLKLLIGIGKCIGIDGKIHERHEIFWQSMSLLVSGKPFRHTSATISLSSLLDYIGKEIPGDSFAIERAEILYHICWFSLKNYHSVDSRAACCALSHVQISGIVSWLLQAFILSRELPLIFQKVSRLLASIFLLSCSGGHFSLPLYFEKDLSGWHWAAYFHQASIGTHANHQLLSSMGGKLVTNSGNFEESNIAVSLSSRTEICNLVRHAPETVKDLKEFVKHFYETLPSTTVICISLLGGAYTILLRELLDSPYSFPAWLLISRFNSKYQPVVMLLPVNSILEDVPDDAANSILGSVTVSKDTCKKWSCPWSPDVVDKVAPQFRMILEDNYLSSSMSSMNDTQTSRLLWWTWRKNLNHRLDRFLSSMEDLWLGPWKCLLLGERSDYEHLDSLVEKLIDDLKCQFRLNSYKNLIRVILGGARYASEIEACISQVLQHNGYLGRGSCCKEEKNEAQSDSWDRVEILSESASRLVVEAANELQEGWFNREPIILVLDSQVQMLPWENLPILRKQEVYRMPSVGSVSATLNRSCIHQEKDGRIVTAFPLIDPLDAFYLLNPSGDLSRTQIEFEDWFRDQKLEGKAGMAPTTEELALALKNHDLFIYFGHGSGTQYMPQHEIQKLETCAATLLMGCSSGSLSLMGCYTPQGAPLSYLLAGSPVIVANLWEVTDKDIDRFGKAMLSALLQERSAPTDCPHRNLVKEFESMNILSNRSKKVRRKKLQKPCDGAIHKDCCGPRPKIGSFMCQAREACTLPFLIGAAPVCYGVPTGIAKKRDI